MDIVLSVNKADVFSEVGRKCGYVGSKNDEDEKAYHRIRTIDEDMPELEKLWGESRSEFVSIVSGMFASDEEVPDETGTRYRITLNVWDDFNTSLIPVIETDLYNWFVYYIVSLWFGYTNKGEAVSYEEHALNCLSRVRSHLTHRFFTRGSHPSW